MRQPKSNSDYNRSINIVGLSSQGGEAVLIPEGNYRLKLLSHCTAVQFGTSKLILTFQIAEFGPYLGVELKAYYNVEAHLGKVGNNGRVRHKRTGDFLIQYFTIFSSHKLKRRDRVPMDPLYNSVIIGKVRTVKSSHSHAKLPEQLWYSKVGELIRVEV